MFKRTAPEAANPSKRIKADNEMPPPSFVPRQSSTSSNIHKSQQQSSTSQKSSSSKSDTKFKLQTSIKDMKSHQNDYFSGDDDDDEDLWFKASQIEEQELKNIQKNSPNLTEVSYSEFQDAQGPTSTQAQATQNDLQSSQKIRVLQNKCSALEKQLKRSLPNIAKAQTMASQATCEVNELRTKLKKLMLENEELKKEKLNEADRISTATSTIRNENEALRQQILKLEREVRDSNQTVTVNDRDSQLSPSEVRNARLHEMIFDGIRISNLNEILAKARAYQELKFDEGDRNSIFHRHLVSLQLKLAEVQSNMLENYDRSLLMFCTLRMPGRSSSNDFLMFNEITKVIFDISDDIKSSGLRHLDEHFVRQEFAYKQTQYCSDQYFGDKKNSKKKVEDTQNRLTNSVKLFEDEIRVDHRRLIAIISLLMKNSINLSKMMLVQNVSTNDYKTLIDIICEIIDPHILQSRFLYKNSGITEAFADLARNLASHYGNFTENLDVIDKNFERIFSHLLAMSTNNPRILLKFTEFLINLLKHKNGTKILKNLCKNFPSSNLEFSQMFRIYQIPRCGCMLQIFFILLTTAFRFIENVEKHNLHVLFELTINLNTLVLFFSSNDCDLKFLKPQSYESCDVKSFCKCYMFLVIALIILNGLALRHRNVDSNKYYTQLSNITKSVVISLVAVLSYTGHTIDYRSFTFGYNAINEIYTWIKHGDIYVEEFDKYFNCKDMFLTQGSHEIFLEKILSSTSCDYSYSFITYPDSNPNIDGENVDINLAKESLWKEINEEFKKDESGL